MIRAPMEDSDCSTSLLNLVCFEDGSLLDQENEEKQTITTEAEEEDYIQTLVSRESSSFESRTLCSSSNYSTSFSRSHAIQWILKMKSFFGFRDETAYLAIAYLDQFFTCRAVDKGKSWAVHLAATACLSLAAKMEECLPPALSEFHTTEDWHFDCKTIQRMELLVLNAMEWRMNSVTPLDYLAYFLSKFPMKNSSKDVLLCRAIRFIFATIQGVSLMDYRPSAIAAAAILAVSDDQRLTKKMVEAKMSLVCLNAEHVFSCYRMMIQELHQEKVNPSIILASSDEQSTSVSSSVDAIETYSSMTGSSSKRRRLQLAHIK